MICLRKCGLSFLVNGIGLMLLSVIFYQHDSIQAVPLQKTINFNAEPVQTCESKCESHKCHSTAEHFLFLLNQTVDPCDDFYEFACGGIKEINISEEQNVFDAYSALSAETKDKLIRAVKEDVEVNELSAITKMKNYFQNCINVSRIEHDGAQPLLKILQKFGGWPVLLGNRWNEAEFDWKNHMGKVLELLPINFPVTFDTVVHPLDSSKNIFKVLNPQTSISRIFKIENYVNYFEYILKTAIELGANPIAVLEEVKGIVDFEVELFKIRTLNDGINQQHMTIKDLSMKHSGIPWLELINKKFNSAGLFFNDSEIVLISNPNTITEIENLIQRTPKRTIANYSIWLLIEISLTYMSQNFQNITSEFLSKVQWQQYREQRESSCFNQVRQKFSLAMDAMYVRKYFKKAAKEKVNVIVQDIKEEARKNLEKTDWIDSNTRKYALEKLNAMGAFVAYADEIMDDQKINEYFSSFEINPGSFLESFFNASIFEFKKAFVHFRNPIDKYHWTKLVSPTNVNGFYTFAINSIQLPAAFLQGSFFQLDRPQYLNYGAIGSIIGHEITHGFDNRGRLFDKNGNINNWWDANTEEKFLERAQCMIDQYDNFIEPTFNLKVNGSITLNENIADNGGYKLAYRAYNEWIKRNNITEDCLPNLNYTPRQMFWISAAKIKCSKARLQFIQHVLAGDPHPPDSARVTIGFANMQEFADDFKCQVGSKMNPIKKCFVW